MDRRGFLVRFGLHGLAALGFAADSALRRPLLAEAGTVRRPIVGLNAHLLTPEAIRLLVDLGVTHVRHTLYWPLWSHPTYPISFAENVERATRAGLRLTLVVHNWDGGRVFDTGVNRSMMRDFGRFIAERARQFPQVEAWQLWNEQDLWVQAPFGASSRLPFRRRGQLYAEQLDIAYPLIKRQNPNALVVSGGIAEHPDRGFLRGLVEQRPPVDAIAVHVYGPYPIFRERVVSAREIVGDLAPIWVTEAGQDLRDDDAHLAVWRSVIEGNTREQLAERIYPYVLEGGETELGQGLLMPGRGVRPTYRWLREYLRR